jgi:pimeloyl-ACP methyl ester carboxylesterase
MKTYPSEGLSPWSDIWVRANFRVQQHALSGQGRLRTPTGATLMRGTPAECIAAAQNHAPRTNNKRAAILLHGLWHHRGAMQRLETALQENGWATANIGYSSRLLPLESHAATASAIAHTLTEDGAQKITFIGHSLGGLIARAAQARAAQDGWNPGPLIAIGSPARGAAFVDRYLAPIPFCKTAIGACHPVLTPNTAVPPPVTDRVLIIAGGNGKNGYNPLIAGDNDWLVAVSETRLPGYETAFHLVPAMHRALPGRSETIAATLKFLQTVTNQSSQGVRYV